MLLSNRGFLHSQTVQERCLRSRQTASIRVRLLEYDCWKKESHCCKIFARKCKYPTHACTWKYLCVLRDARRIIVGVIGLPDRWGPIRRQTQHDCKPNQFPASKYVQNVSIASTDKTASLSVTCTLSIQCTGPRVRALVRDHSTWCSICRTNRTCKYPDWYFLTPTKVVSIFHGVPL